MRKGRTWLLMEATVVHPLPDTPCCSAVTAMPDYDAIVIGAGHSGLTAAAVMARQKGNPSRRRAPSGRCTPPAGEVQHVQSGMTIAPPACSTVTGSATGTQPSLP